MDYYYGGRRGGDSVLDTLSLYPVPYPVLLILAVVLLLLGFSSFLSVESAVEDAEEQMNWALLAVPLLLILAIRWLSSMETPGFLRFGTSPYDRRPWWYSAAPQEGASPWGVAAVVVLLLVLVSYQSTFRDMWLI